MKYKNQDACSTLRLTAKRKPGGKKGKFVGGPTAESHFQSLFLRRNCPDWLLAETSTVPFKSPTSRSSGPETSVDGHAGDEEIFSTWVLLFSVSLFHNRSPESRSWWSASSAVLLFFFPSVWWGVWVLLGPSFILAQQEAPSVQVLAVVERHVVDTLDVRL